MGEGPQRLGKYEIAQEIGRGAFAAVYRALDTTLDRDVALKILHPQLLTDTAFIERFQREARALARLTHPHIVTVFEIGDAEGRAYIAMELADGPDLGRAIGEQGRFSWERGLELLQPVCEALEHAHARDLVHRDLKPSNVLLDGERGVLLTDFGFARLMGESSMSLSLSGGILGTPAYIAPEVWELDAAGPSADVYALGCILYEMLTGDVLFEGKTPMQVMRAHDRGPQFPGEWPEDAPEGIGGVLEKALARDPAARYGGAMGLWHALNDLEAQAQAEREAAEREAVAAQWRAETEAALEAGKWSAAKMALGRWLAVAPQDPLAEAARVEIERRVARVPEREDEAAQRTVCPHCGHGNREGALVCQGCGRRFDELSARPRTDARVPARGEGASWMERIPTLGWVFCGLGVVVLMALLAGWLDQPVEVVHVPVETTSTPAATLLRTRVLPTTTPTRVPPTDIPEPAAPSLGDTWTRSSDDMVMVYVPAGEFQMGSTDDEVDAALDLCNQYYDNCQRGWFEEERPAHTVALDGFWIDRTEVTNAQYARCVADGDCEESEYADDRRFNRAYYPVVGLDWHNAAAYCDWVGARLPTEAEWEYAARGPERRTFPWGDTFDGTRLNFCDAKCEHDWRAAEYDDGYRFTAPVGSYLDGASWCGALDMAGNAWEWVADWYGPYPSGRQVNPTGPSSGGYRVLRGGSWLDSPFHTRSATRLWYHPVNARNLGGLRCARGSQ